MTNPEAIPEAKTRRGLSFRAKSTLIFVGLFALLIAALWLINSIYLQKYYLRQQLARLEDTRRQVEELAKDPDDEDLELRLTLPTNSICRRNYTASKVWIICKIILQLLITQCHIHVVSILIRHMNL